MTDKQVTNEMINIAMNEWHKVVEPRYEAMKAAHPLIVVQASTPSVVPVMGPRSPPEQVSKASDQSPSSGALSNAEKRARLLSMKPANIGDFYSIATKELGYRNKTEVLAGLGVGVKETDIVDLVHALRALVTKKYPEAKEA